MTASHQRVNILGVGVGAVTMPQAVGLIGRWIKQRRPNYVCVTSIHGVVESRFDDQLGLIHNRAGLVTADGMPLVWFGRLRGFRQMERVYGPDLLLAVCQASVAPGWRHFFYGGTEGVAQQLAERLSQRFEGLQVAGTYTPPFRALSEEEEGEVQSLVASTRADIVWVGLSTPKQERWMAAHVGGWAVPVLIGVGAAFDFHAGVKAQAPGWVQRSGLEWCFRLLQEPRRLWRRYLRNIPVFVVLALLQQLGLKRFRLAGQDPDS